MTEDEFIEGYVRFCAVRGGNGRWVDYICKPENHYLYVLTLNENDTSVEELRTAWQIENSPLAKALK